ncbi:MAG TPA: type II toxin-antitoxin system mRNA interferase toxin, RelE/StbE family [Candidatus Moranbacteria bacterium]|nr:type II toxin-antitoxin system mRNA interferase toxin, RelE/StbE family [Candidatus Moranbacteria bacterium]
MKILYLTKFARQFKKLPKSIKKSAVEKEKIFRKNPFDKSLKTHKLHGHLKSFWAFSVDSKNRIIFDFQDKNTVRFYSIGNHDIYY